MVRNGLCRSLRVEVVDTFNVVVDVLLGCDDNDAAEPFRHGGFTLKGECVGDDAVFYFHYGVRVVGFRTGIDPIGRYLSFSLHFSFVMVRMNSSFSHRVQP